jgi:large subunit ribosomal protein L22
VAKAVVDNGPTIPRYWPRARGSASPIRKKMGHISIVLTDEKPSKK